MGVAMRMRISTIGGPRIALAAAFVVTATLAQAVATAAPGAGVSAVDDARALARAVSSRSTDRLAVAVAGADQATAVEARALGVELRSAPLPVHASPSEAVLAVAAGRGVRVGAG